MLPTPLASKQLGYENIIEAWKTITTKLHEDLDSISMPKLLESGMGPKGMG
jgi:hypothetical protein